MRISLLLLTVAVAAPAFAGPVRLKGGQKSEDKLRQFVVGDAKLKARLDDAAKREAAFVAESRESLRDAVADKTPEEISAEAAQTTGEKRKAVLEALPGMKAVSGPACATLADCANPAMSMEVSDARNLPDSIRLMVRPWMALQQARGSEIEVAPAEGNGDAALTVKLKGVETHPLILNVSPHLLGGFTVWYDQPQVSAAVFARERAAVLKTK